MEIWSEELVLVLEEDGGGSGLSFPPSEWGPPVLTRVWGYSQSLQLTATYQGYIEFIDTLDTAGP